MFMTLQLDCLVGSEHSDNAWSERAGLSAELKLIIQFRSGWNVHWNETGGVGRVNAAGF